jgi:hypothetical protein
MNFFEYDNNHTETNLNNLMNVSDLTCTAIDVIEMHKLYELCEKDISDDISDNLVSKPSIDMNEFEILLVSTYYVCNNHRTVITGDVLHDALCICYMSVVIKLY